MLTRQVLLTQELHNVDPIFDDYDVHFDELASTGDYIKFQLSAFHQKSLRHYTSVTSYSATSRQYANDFKSEIVKRLVYEVRDAIYADLALPIVLPILYNCISDLLT